jgi:hypothetical protein
MLDEDNDGSAHDPSAPIRSSRSTTAGAASGPRPRIST